MTLGRNNHDAKVAPFAHSAKKREHPSGKRVGKEEELPLFTLFTYLPCEPQDTNK